MCLHRYGGDFGRWLTLPFAALVRLVGAAKRATEIKKDGRPGDGDGPEKRSDDDIIRELEALRAAASAPEPTPA